MSLPGSGQISFDDVRVEMSQSLLSNYSIREWAGGRNSSNVGVGTLSFSPINILSSGSRFSESSRMSNTNLSPSAWYGYDHTLNIPLNVTGTLYTHMEPVSGDGQYSIYNTSVLIVDIGTTSATMSINISGSADYAEETLTVFYGKPWTNTGTGSPNTSLILQTTIGNYPGTFNYTYDSAKGQYLYFVLSYAAPGAFP
jgi:hypothetical protein